MFTIFRKSMCPNVRPTQSMCPNVRPTPKIAKISKSYRKRSESVSFGSKGRESKKSILASKGRSLTMVGEKMKANVTKNNLRK